MGDKDFAPTVQKYWEDVLSENLYPNLYLGAQVANYAISGYHGPDEPTEPIFIFKCKYCGNLRPSHIEQCLGCGAREADKV